ncbi:MAG TPA: helix-turn-helix transcriptional regulator [Thermoanaerobacterales bacterium]|jgi:DNA-binding Xre family transcriptional regulator|nr:helix-turn-helix transcriptional regulator [Thermoanaerobacterales bacterium]
MAFSYKPLWHLLLDRGITKTQLREMTGIGTATLAKLSKDQEVSMSVIHKICIALDCEIQDVVQIVKKND